MCLYCYSSSRLYESKNVHGRVYVLVCNFLSDQEFMYMELSMSENVCIHAPFLKMFAFIMFQYWNMRCPLCAPNMV